MSETESLFDKIIENKQESKKTKQTQVKDESQADVIQQLLNEVKALKKELNEVKNNSESGNPANEWAKKLAQEKANRKAKPFKTIYTLKDGKVLKVDVKKNGSYSTFIGNIKMHKDQVKDPIAGWKKEGIWVDEFEFDAKTKEIMDALED